jgi:tetratricopeptide repeat protein 8
LTALVDRVPRSCRSPFTSFPQGVAEVLLDENATAQMPRPGTSLMRPNTAARAGQPSAATRPVTASGRPATGFARPATGSRPMTGAGGGIEGAFRGGRPGTTRPVTSSGRFVRLGTASMLAEPGGPFINLEKLDLRKYAARPALARALCDYALVHDRNPRKAVELASLATVASGFGDWWWKERLGKGYYQLGLLRDAEKQFKSALKDCSMVSTILQLAKIYIRLDQPFAAVLAYEQGAAAYPGETSFLLGQARICDALNEMQEGVELYKETLRWDASNVEAVACLASHHFYTDQPEIALRFYRRLLSMGVDSTELWCNVGLCCFYASQYDMCLSCFERALALADDDNMADVWYNVGHVAVGAGDANLAYQAFKIAVSVDANHAESHNNLGVLEARKGNPEAARACFAAALQEGDHAFEPFYNDALCAFRAGDFQSAFERVEKALAAFPEHADSADLKKQLTQHFTLL